VLNKKYMRILNEIGRKKAPGRRLYRLWIGGERGLSQGPPERYPLSRQRPRRVALLRLLPTS